MSKKINVDYFRNKLDKLPEVQLPQVKLPKIKSRKIFSTKGPNENVPPPLPKEPPPRTIVDHSPVTISTISQMVDGAPTYDYSFGGARVSEEVIERHQREDETASNQGAAKDNDKPPKTNLKFSEKLSKHYKELSEFKFKNILGKKTVVKTTMIQVDDYKQRYEEEKNERTSDHEDYDFDVDSLPPGSANPSRRCSEVASLGPEANESRRGSESASLGPSNPQSRRDSEIASIRRGRSLAEIPLNSESLNNLDDLDELEEVPPNESSLYRIKEHAVISASTSAVAIDIESPTKDVAPTPSGNNSKRSHRQRFDNACGRAKKAVNSKFQKFKQLRTRNTQDQTQDQQEAPAPKVPVRKPTYKKSVKKRSDVIKQDSVSSVPSVRSEQESLGSPDKSVSLDLEPPRPEWVAKRILSTESKKGTPHLLRSQLRAQYSMESYDSEREVTVTRKAPPPPVAKLQLPPGDEWVPARPVSRLGQHSENEWGPIPSISKLGQSSEDEWGPTPQISKIRQQSEDEWGPASSISKLRQQSEDEWGPTQLNSQLRQQSEDEWGPTPSISKLHQQPEDEWGPQLIVTKFPQLPVDEWGPSPLASKLRQPPIDEWGSPPPLPKLQQPSLEDWGPEPPLPDLPLNEWGPAPSIPKVHQSPPDEWSPAPALPKLKQPSLESEWGPTHSLPKVPQPSLEEEWSPKIQKLRQQQARDEWGSLPPPPNQTAVLVHKKGTFSETAKGHLRKPSMDSNDSDSWIPETYRNIPRQQTGLNKIEEIDTEPWSVQGVGVASRASGECNTKRELQKSFDIFASEEESEKAFADFDDALKNVPVIPIVLRKNDTVAPPLQLQSSLELDDHSQKPFVKQTSLSRQFSDEIEAKNLDIDVNKLITQFEPFPPLEIQKIQVMAIVETAELHYVKNSPTEPQIPNGTGMDQLPQFPEPQGQHTISEAGTGAGAPAPNPCLESIRASRSRRISAKEWAARARATRSLESGAFGSDEIFYSFEKEHHGVTPSTSPPQRLIKRQVYRIDL